MAQPTRMNKIFNFFRTPRGASESTNKMPPQALEMEQAVVSAILNDPRSIHRATGILKPEMFFAPQLQTMFRALVEMYTKGQAIDLLTYIDHLKKSGDLGAVGGLSYVTEISSKTASAANIEYHVKVIAQHWLKREMIKIGNALADGGYDSTIDVFDLMEAGSSEIGDLLTGVEVDGGTLEDAVYEVVADIEKAKSGKIIPITAGFPELDDLLLQAGDLVILAGRASMGKTALALALAVEMSVKHNIPVLYNSLEMDKKRLTQRLLSSYHSIKTARLVTGEGITIDHIASFYAYGKAKLKNVLFRDCRTVLSLRAAVHRHRAKKGLLATTTVVIIVDYLQLMVGVKQDGNREQEVASLSRGLKELAVADNCIIIALSQLSRAVETRSNKEPMLSDLRESGAIEQDADIVLFAYRPEYYGLMVDELGGSLRGIGFVIEAKNRTGIVGDGRHRMGFHGGMWVSLNDPKLKEQPLPNPRRVDPNYSLDNEIPNNPF